ncbi:MAG: MFS transporter [Pontiellaceae bacterium]|nr:MFS transporter [Pontiellaceae bacterium]
MNAQSKASRAAVFLDRDGTLIEDVGTLASPEDVRLFPDTVRALSSLQEKYLLFVITNQSGISSGTLTRRQVDLVNAHLDDMLRREGVVIQEWYVCPHHRADGCSCIKPKPQFVRVAQKEYGLALDRSFIIGDHPHDAYTGNELGVFGLYLLTGHGGRHLVDLEPDTLVFHRISDAADWILAHPRHQADLQEHIEKGAETIRSRGWGAPLKIVLRRLQRGGWITMPNRWLVLMAGCLIQTVLGGIYAWSTFVPYLTHDYGLSTGQCGLVFGATILTFTSTMVFAGRVLVKKGPRFTASISAVLFAMGYLFASVSGGSFALLLLSLGGLVGGGIGFGYVCPLSVGMKWFPEKKGMVTGVAVAGFGFGAILLSSIAEYFLLHGTDVLTFYRWFGLAAGLILFIAAQLLSEPSATAVDTLAAHDYSSVFTWPFCINMMGIFAGTFAGLLIIGNLTPIVMGAGLSERQAALAVSIFAIGNGVGRMVWGKLFDFCHYRSIPYSLMGLALVTGLLLLPIPGWTLMISVGLVGFCFGANFVLYASAISRFFGTASFPRLYPICFMAYGVAGIIGPGLGGSLADSTGSYHIPVYLCIAILVLAGIFTHLKLTVFNHHQTQKEESLNEKQTSCRHRYGKCVR